MKVAEEHKEKLKCIIFCDSPACNNIAIVRVEMLRGVESKVKKAVCAIHLQKWMDKLFGK